jgi:hypothetical protein
MTARINFVVVASLFVASIAFGQMKYSRPRSQQSPTPTPSPTPQQSPAPAANQRRTIAPPSSAQARPVPSMAMIPAQKPGTVPAQPRSTGSMPMIPSQKPGTVPIQSKQNPAQPQTQRTMAGTVQPNQALTAAQRGTAAQMQPKFAATPAPVPAKPTPTPVPPPDVKAYVDKQLSKDQKFHMNVNGKDLALTPFHVWWQKSTGPNTTSTTVSMRSDEGRVYDIDFMTTGAQVTSIRISRINGESVR